MALISIFRSIAIDAFLSRMTHSKLSQNEYLTRILARMSVRGILFAMGEKVCFTVLRSLKKYDPGAQCGIEYYIMYCKFSRVQKYEFLIFGIFVVQGKTCIYMI